MNTKPIDKSKKSNIKCEHCEYWCGEEFLDTTVCIISQTRKNYWHRCKDFEWAKDKEYKDENSN